MDSSKQDTPVVNNDIMADIDKPREPYVYFPQHSSPYVLPTPTPINTSQYHNFQQSSLHVTQGFNSNSTSSGLVAQNSKLLYDTNFILSSQNNEISELKKHIYYLQTVNSQYSIEISSLKSCISTSFTNNNKQSEKYKQQIDELVKERNQMALKYSSIYEEKQRLVIELKNIEQKMEVLKKSAANVPKDYYYLIDRNEKLGNKNSQLLRSVGEHKEYCDNTKQSLYKARRDLETSRLDKVDSARYIESLHVKILNLENNVTKLEKKLSKCDK